MSDAALPPPPIATEAGAREVLRVWACPGAAQQVALRTVWRDPAAWGLLLADAARHAAKTHARDGMTETEALARIVRAFEAEMAVPTDDPTRIEG